MKMARHQAGMTLIGWMFVFVVMGFLSIFFIKLVPVYIENFTVGSILRGLKNDAGGDYSSPQSVRETIKRRFDMNNIEGLKAEDVLIEPSGSGFSLSANYEVRVPFVYNIDLVTKFSENAQVPKR